jgi:transposase
MAYSMDLRRKVLQACDDGWPTKDVARMFKVARSWVRRLKQRRRDEGTIEPGAQQHGPEPELTKDDRQRIKVALKAQPDLTLLQLRERLNLSVSEPTIWRAARAMGFSFKKRAFPPANSSGVM